MNPRALAWAVACLGAAGLGVFVWMLTQSWRPSERANALYMVYDIPMPSPGAYTVFNGRSARLYVMRSPSGAVWALRVPLREGAVIMPDLHWWRPMYRCKDFGIDGVGDRFAASGMFQCRDAQVPEWWKPRWQWHADGKAVAGDTGIDSMDVVPIRIENDTIHIYSWDRM